MLLRHEEDVEIGPERTAYIGQQKIEGVERKGVEARRDAGRASRRKLGRHRQPVRSGALGAGISADGVTDSLPRRERNMASLIFAPIQARDLMNNIGQASSRANRRDQG